MSCRYSRRKFVKGAVGTAAAASLAMSMEEKALAAQAAGEAGADGTKEPSLGKVKPESKNSLAKGKIGGLEISRVILGGNLIGGWAHSRDLMYVSKLLKAYHTDEKVLDTLQAAEEHGINCINTHPNAGRLIQQYRKERGGKMLWMVQAFHDEKGDFGPCIRAAVEQGVDLIQIQGGAADKIVRSGKVDWLDAGIRAIQAQALPAGIGAHALDTIKACQKKGFQADFYVKTFHHHDYRTAPTQEQVTDPHREVPGYWCDDPAATRDYMKGIKKPWIAFKVMAAGAIHPRKAFRYCFENGADFIFAGMFDFQVAEDVQIAQQALKSPKRQRPWLA